MPHAPRAPLLLLPLLLVLAPAAPAVAQEPPTASEKNAWTEQLQRTVARLAELEGAAEPAAAAESELLSGRRSLLGELLAVAAILERVGDPATLERRVAAERGRLARLRATEPAPVTAVADADELRRHQEEFAAAEERLAAARDALRGISRRRDGAPAQRAALDDRIAEVERARAGLEEATDPLDRERAANLALERRLLALQDLLLGLQPDPWSGLIALAQIELDAAQLRFERAEGALARARELWNLRQRREAERLRAQARALEQRAARETDPLARFALATRARVLEHRAETRDGATTVAELTGRLEVDRQALARVRSDRQRLERRLRLTEGVSDSVARLLVNTIERSARIRRTLETRLRPQLFAEIEANRTRLATVQDRVWELQTPLDENPAWRKLVESAPAAPDAERERAFRDALQGEDGLLPALLAHQARLEEIDQLLNELEQLSLQRIEAWNALYGFAQSNVYWVRSAEPLSLDLLRRAAEELPALPRALSRGADLRAAGDGFRRSPWTSLSLGLLLAASLGFAVWLGRRLRRQRAVLLAGRSRGAALTISAAMAVLISAPVPLVLLGSARLLRMLALPDAYQDPGSLVLRSLALLWFVRGLASRVLRPDGLAVAGYGVAPALAAQLHRSIRILLAAALVLLLPGWVLHAPPFSLAAIPRLLYTGFLAATALALLLLLRRGGALVHVWTRGRGLLYRAWGVLGPLFGLGLFALVAMDALGYRVGAHFLMRNVALTVAALLAIRALYALTRGLVEVVTRRVHHRTAEEEGARAAYQTSSVVMQQLTRVVSLAILVPAVIVLADFWGFGGALESSLRSVVLVRVDADSLLTLWEVALALAWIVGSHFVLRNLAGLYEFLVFPLVGEGAGNRYVILAISRYLIFVVGYAAALLTLQFPFSSLGWIVAAASVGLGFGLQEIVANFVSGLILLLERPVRVGDIITVGDTGGTIERITIRATVVTNWDLQEIVIPNKSFITDNVTNWTLNHNVMRRRLRVGVRYGSDTGKVLEILRAVVDGHPSIHAQPPPRVLFDGFGESSLDFEIWAFTEIGNGLAMLSDMRGEIHRRFAEAGIEIPFPQRDLHVRSMDPRVAEGLRGAGDARED